jgi:hypothetical protein
MAWVRPSHRFGLRHGLDARLSIACLPMLVTIAIDTQGERSLLYGS